MSSRGPAQAPWRSWRAAASRPKADAEIVARGLGRELRALQSINRLAFSLRCVSFWLMHRDGLFDLSPGAHHWIQRSHGAS